MIRSLRRTHRLVWTLLAVVLPLLLALALAARPPAPQVDRLPDAAPSRADGMSR